jgi:hypothetical protein
MQLLLSPLTKALRGIYDIDRDGVKNELPHRALYAHPDLARAISKMEDDGLHLVYSDIYRSAASSLARRREFEKAGGPQLAKRPGESPHNFGLAIDIDVTQACQDLQVTKRGLDTLLQRYDLFCHRRDSKMGAEAWHYNHLGPVPAYHLKHASPTSTARAVEAKVSAIYGGQMKLSRDEIVSALKQSGFLKSGMATSADIDAAVRAFQAFWDLAVDGAPGPKTQRLLAFVTASTQLVIL